jgi:hypothetical protein
MSVDKGFGDFEIGDWTAGIMSSGGGKKGGLVFYLGAGGGREFWMEILSGRKTVCTSEARRVE